jgi:hypothetical protein
MLQIEPTGELSTYWKSIKPELHVTLNNNVFAHDSLMVPICDRLRINRLFLNWSIAIRIITCPLPLISAHLINPVLCSAAIDLEKQFQKENEIRWKRSSLIQSRTHILHELKTPIS